MNINTRTVYRALSLDSLGNIKNSIADTITPIPLLRY